MNTQALIELRDHILSIPEEQFDYNYFLSDDGDSQPEYAWADGIMPPCGTAGCVAGHCIICFKLECHNGLDIEDTARHHLGLSNGDAYSLFIRGCGTATRNDAIRRLNYLIDEGTLVGYDFVEEEGWDENWI